jgi:hypothetical protein
MADLGMRYETSYFSAPNPTLDPKLFEGRNLKSSIRNGINHLLMDFLGRKFRHADLWTHAWLAGSGVSYQWSAARQPADLDCLVGVDYEQFRKANPEYVGLSDKEISSYINEDFYNELAPSTANWNGFELTFYVNPGATDIRTIRPYAAYDLTYDEWTVYPDPNQQPPNNPSWQNTGINDEKMASQIHLRYQTAVGDLRLARDEATRRNAQTRADSALAQGVALFEEIHGGRKLAFGSTGQGYADFNNYRWQMAKASGTYQKLKELQDEHTSSKESFEASRYGVELPDADVLIRRAATYRTV